MSTTWKAVGAAIAVAAILLFAFGVYLVMRYKTYTMPTDSMAPTIRAHQMFAVDRFAYRSTPPRPGDVVMFMPPVRSDAPFLKRVVAVPGDRFAIRGGGTYLNGKRLDEPYAPKPAPYDLGVRDYDLWVDGERIDHAFAMIPPRAQWTAPDTVPRGCYVVLGDDRPNSEDTHAFGFFCPDQPVPTDPQLRPQLVGRAILPSR